MIGTITVNPSIDQHILVERLLKDDTNRALAVHRYPGGKGINVSKVVRELGGPTRAWALLGGFPGEFLKELLKPLDVPLCAIQIQGNTRINTILTETKEKTQSRISDPGPKIYFKEFQALKRQLQSFKPKPFLWALGGSLSDGMDPSAYQEIILALQKKGTPCVLDTDGTALQLGAKAKPFMIKPNEHEMQRLMGHSFKKVNDYARAARELVRGGITIVVVSLGKKGALFVSAEEAFHVLVPEVVVRSKVGAGDSLIAGLLLGLYHKKSLRSAACLGMAASVSAVMREAPRLCQQKDIPGLLRRIRIRNL